VDVIRDSFPSRPALDIAVSHALLLEVAGGERAPALRVYHPGATLAFGRLDRLREGFAEAAAAARGHGYQPVLRIAGGHAAAYHPACVVYEEIVPDSDIGKLHRRFRHASALIVDALRALGADVAVGQLPGEYCPGAYSVIAAERLKVAGLAQRVIRGGALLSAVVVVANGADVREVLIAVYAALGLDWDPRTAGAVEDVRPSAGAAAVARALVAAAATRRELSEGALGEATLEHAQELLPQHEAA
jgi:lipoate-protein ligase A